MKQDDVRAKAREVLEAVERISAAMMGQIPGSLETSEEPCGGLVAVSTKVKVSYNDLRIVLGHLDGAPRQGDREALRKLVDALVRHHQWHAAQTDPDPEHGFVPADEYADSTMYDQTVEALAAANTILADGPVNAALGPVEGKQ